MMNAYIIGLVIAFFTPLAGLFMVLRRYAMIGDTLAHIALAGVAIGIVVGTLPTFIAFAVTVAAAVLIEYLREYRKVSGESALAMLLYGGLALAVVLFGVAKQDINEDLLFGSLETVKAGHLGPVVLIAAVVLFAVLMFWKELTYSSFDEETARVQGVPVRFVNMLLVVLTAVTVSFALKIVGVLLVGALMVIPVLTALQVARSFRSASVIAVVASMLSVLVGLAAAQRYSLAAGGVIVLAAFVLFFIALGVRRFTRV